MQLLLDDQLGTNANPQHTGAGDGAKLTCAYAAKYTGKNDTQIAEAASTFSMTPPSAGAARSSTRPLLTSCSSGPGARRREMRP